MTRGSEYLSLAAVVIAAFVGFKLAERRLNQRGRDLLLDSLEVLDPERRARRLKRFTPKVQAELREKLEHGARSPNPSRHGLNGAQWFSFLAATRGAKIHRILDGVLVIFLVAGMLGGGILGFLVSGYFASDIQAVWVGAFLIIGMFGAMFGFAAFRFWVLGLAFRRYLARLRV